jgi:serine/threonine protein kinase
MVKLLSGDASLGASPAAGAPAMRARASTLCGSSFYMAPEVAHYTAEVAAGGYGPGVDVWAAGVVLYILLSGNCPWEQHLVPPARVGPPLSWPYPGPARLVRRLTARTPLQVPHPHTPAGEPVAQVRSM